MCNFGAPRIQNHTDADTITLQNNFQINSNEHSLGKWMKSDNDLWFEAGIKENFFIGVSFLFYFDS